MIFITFLLYSENQATLWEQVMRQFNSRSLVQRSRHQIQTLYKNMKAKAKKYQLRILEAEKEGLPLPEYDDVSEMLLKMLAGEKNQEKMHLDEANMILSSIDDSEDNTKCPTESFKPEQVNYNIFFISKEFFQHLNILIESYSFN